MEDQREIAKHEVDAKEDRSEDVDVETVKRRRSVFDRYSKMAWKELIFNFAYPATATSILAVASENGLVSTNPLGDDSVGFAFVLWFMVVGACFFEVISSRRKSEKIRSILDEYAKTEDLPPRWEFEANYGAEENWHRSIARVTASTGVIFIIISSVLGGGSALGLFLLIVTMLGLGAIYYWFIGSIIVGILSMSSFIDERWGITSRFDNVKGCIDTRLKKTVSEHVISSSGMTGDEDEDEVSEG